MPKTITVTNILRASYLADGSMVEMEFAGLNAEKFALRFSPDKLESFVAQARQVSHARHQYRTDERGRILSAFMPTAMDLFVVPTVSFRLLCGLSIMENGRRQIRWFGGMVKFETISASQIVRRKQAKGIAQCDAINQAFSVCRHMANAASVVRLLIASF
jgi:hypothetical protein